MSYYFYDLETSGVDPRWQRIMQFAGQRTDDDFNPIGEPHNVLVKLTDEVLPDPEAILITGITPQKTIEEGVTEATFLQMLQQEVFTKDTTVLGFNTIRFDDEFMRYTLYRNFYDPYEREWQEGRSRWDIMDVVRMTRALRPEGIKWPVDAQGRATNRLELLAKENSITHLSAHDALSDVLATIEVAKLIKQKQPKLFAHLLKYKHKKLLAKLINVKEPQPLVHTSGMFRSEFLSTSAVYPIAPHPRNSNAILVYDLRFSPAQWANTTVDELAQRLFMTSKERMSKGLDRVPVKAIHLNKSPAVAPIGVLDEASQERISLTIAQVTAHLSELQALSGFGERLFSAFERSELPEIDDVDGQLYGGFVNDADKRLMQQVRNRGVNDLADWQPDFTDTRLAQLLPKYKARNFPKSLTPDERAHWEAYRAKRLSTNNAGLGFTSYFTRLAKLAAEEDNKKDPQRSFLLEELKLYGESLVPFENGTLFSDV